jgi:hypothetical protein
MITNFDTSIKKDIISISLFKMRGGGYKDFSHYLKALKNICEKAKETDTLFVRLFIDKNIECDEKIMTFLKKLEKISIVVFECSDFVDEGFHYSTFGTLIRMFPLFDFENNDANITIVLDSDPSDNLLNSVLDFYRMIKKYDLTDMYISFIGRYNHANANKIIPIKHNDKTYFIPYCVASRISGCKKVPRHILTDFLDLVIKHTKMDVPSEQLYDYKMSEKEKEKRCEKNICYGIDEYFINKILFKELIINDLPFCYYVNFSMSGYYYFYHPRFYDREVQKMTDLDKNEYTRIFNSYIKRMGLGHISFEKADKLLYVDDITDKETTPFMKKYAKNLTKLFKHLYKKRDFRIFSKGQIFNFFMNDYKNYYMLKQIKFVNSDRDDITLFYTKL